MNTPALLEIEESITHLTLLEQLWLIERLAQIIRENAVRQQADFERQLVEMAGDSEIQSELRMIEEEFAFAEADGLDERQ